MAVKLIGKLGPIDDVEFPNGHTYPARRLDADGYKLRAAAFASGATEDALALLRWIVPDATDEDWSTLDEAGVMAAAIVGHASGQLEAALHLAKNAVAGAAPAARPPRPSNQRTKRSTSSAASPQPSVPTG